MIISFRAGAGRIMLLMAVFSGSVTAVHAQEFRAFWADAFQPGFKSISQIESMVDRAVTGNYNAIIIEVLAYHDEIGTGHGAYWESSIVPKATDIQGDIDPLAEVIAEAHANGIEVHAWIIPFRVSTSWPPAGNNRITQDMLMVPRANIGTRVPLGAWYTLDPGNADVQEYLLDIINELVSNYDIDGINLDRIRYEFEDAGYPATLNNPKSSLERFKAITGFVGTPSFGNSSWSDFRRRGITELVRRIYAEVHANTNNPMQPLNVSADLIAFGDSTPNFRNTSAFQLFQDWLTWVNAGYLDAAIVMNYKREWSGAQDIWYRNWVIQARTWVPADRHYYAGQGNYLNTKADSVTQMSYSLNQGAEGVVNFSYFATADDDRDGFFEPDFTWYTFVSDNLFTTPVPTPDLFWHDPNVSTEACVWGQVINETTGAPIDNAVVQIDGLILRTDGNGYYVQPRISVNSGSRLVTVSAVGDNCSQIWRSATVTPADFVRLDFTLCPLAPLLGDMDKDGDIDFEDYNILTFCYRGEGLIYPAGTDCLLGDFDGDFDVDSDDFAEFQLSYPAP